MVDQFERKKGENGRQWLERLRELPTEKIDARDWDAYQKAFDQALALAEREESREEGSK
jgi:hypothetical protein